MIRGRTIALLLASLLATACENTIHKQIDTSKKGLSLDAKQRLVVVDTEGRKNRNHIICTEPSPDAFTAQAVAFGASGGTLQAGGGFAGSSSEAAAYVGLRTQTIQLLRDGYFRLCEAYMNGALSREQYNLALVNIKKVMIPLMAIDAVAGTPHPPAVAIAPGVAGVSTSANLARNIGTSGGDGDGDGSNSDDRSLDASASVSSTETRIEIQQVNATREGLNEHEAAVLQRALDIAADDTVPLLCLSYLADPGFTETEEGYGLPPKAQLVKNAVLEKCGTLLDHVIAAQAPANVVASDAVKLLERQLEDEKKKTKEARAAVEVEKAKVLQSKDDLVDFSKGTVEGALQKHRPIDVNIVK